MKKHIRSFSFFLCCVVLAIISVEIVISAMLSKQQCDQVRVLFEYPIEMEIVSMRRNFGDFTDIYSLEVLPVNPPTYLPDTLVHMSITADEVFNNWLYVGSTLLVCPELLTRLVGEVIAYTISACTVYPGYQDISHDQEAYTLWYYDERG